MKETFKKIGTKLKASGKEIYFFVSSQIFLKNFAGIVGFIALMLFITFWWMNCFTRHGQSLQVHDYTNMQLEEAIQKAKNKSFQIVTVDSIWRKGVGPGVVLSQQPEPFQRVKKNRKIYITVSSESEDVTIPDPAMDDDFDTYKTALEYKDVEAKVKERRFNSRLEENTILEVIYEDKTISPEELADGFKVKKGSTVWFIVTKRSDNTVNIPDLVCQQFDAAKFLIDASDLNVGSVIADATVNNQSTAYIWKQVPRYSPSARMHVGEPIEIYLTQYKPDRCVEESNIETGFSNESGENEEF